MLYSTMALLHSCFTLSGEINTGVHVRSYDELNEIGENTNSAFLLWQIFMCRISDHFWMREYHSMVKLSEKYSEKYRSSQQKRILQVLRVFYEGVAYLSLARDTKQTNWRIKGENAVSKISHYENTMSKWNFENKSKLLQAELHYLDGDLESAETAYTASIDSARRHKFVNEEALAYEMYGIFCIENHMVDKGSQKLHIALDKYKQWGAIEKAKDVRLFIDLVSPSYLRKLKLI